MKTPTRFSLRSGFASIELIVVIGVIILLSVLLLPRLYPPRRARCAAPRIGCVNNLKQIGTAFRFWSGDNNDKFPMQLSITDTNPGTMEFVNSPNVFPHFQILSNELQTPKVLVCGADDRNPATNFTTDLNNSKVSYFVGVDADESNPQMILAGDRNIAVGSRVQTGLITLTTNQVISWSKKIHNLNGNLLFADGHAEQVTTGKLRDAVKNTGVTTNRLAIP